MIYIKNKNEILLMKKAGKIAKGAGKSARRRLDRELRQKSLTPLPKNS